MDNEKKEEILKKGLELILKKGYYGTGIQEIADTAGIPKGSFYNYFKSKEQFAIELLEESTSALQKQLDRVLNDQTIPSIKRLERLHKGVTYGYIKEGFISFGYLASILSLEMASTDSPITKAINRAFDRIKEPLSHCLQEAKETGDIDPSFDIDKLTEFIQNAWYGALVRTKASKTVIPLDIFYEISMTLIVR